MDSQSVRDRGEKRDDTAVAPAQVLNYLARLAPKRDRTDRTAPWMAAPAQKDMVWLGWLPHAAVDSDATLPDEYNPTGSVLCELPENATKALSVSDRSTREALQRLAAVDELHREENLCRAGWLWLSGTVDIPGSDGEADERRRVCLPIFQRPVRLDTVGELKDSGAQPNWLGPLELHPRLAELGGEEAIGLADQFLNTGAAVTGVRPSPNWHMGGATASALRELLDAVGLHHERLVVPEAHPMSLARTHIVSLVLGAAFFIDREPSASSVQANLSRWVSADVRDSAFAAAYGLDADSPLEADEVIEGGPVLAALPLNRRQEEVVRRVRREQVVAVSGPPGTGKTHVVVAVAADAVARGESVLIATKSDHASESVCEMLDRHPTPPHIRFGQDQHRRAVVNRLSEGTAVAPSSQQQDEAERRAAESLRAWETARTTVLEALRREQAFSKGLAQRTRLAGLTADAPGVLDDDRDIAEVGRLLRRAQRPGMLYAWSRRRAFRRLWSDLRVRPEIAPDAAGLQRVTQAIEAAQAEHDVRHALAHEGLSLEPWWDELERAELAARADLVALETVRRQRAGRRERRRSAASAAALGTVLRAGKNRRAELLTTVENDDFLDQLPLWVGTLDEIERTLPAIVGLFDLVIFDEASQIDQVAAAPALCRADRALIVGDPKQLRHVSFTSDDDTRAALREAAIAEGPLSRILDIRRSSLFDVAAATSPVTWLDEHYRSLPHLIEFSADRFYDGTLRLMTQHPSAENLDCIAVSVVTDARRIDGVNAAEVDAVVRKLRAMLKTAGATPSVGVLTPFRPQADAIEEALLAALSLVEIRRLRLRVGTVHGMQGTERDIIVLSLALTDDDLGRSLQFVQDPNLFNVMITRARNRMVALHSFAPDSLPNGILADWFRYQQDNSSEAPRSTKTDMTADPAWTRTLGDELETADLRVVHDYPVAGWSIDLVVGEGAAAIGVETAVHPDGPDAHIERHLTLRRAGWELTDAFQSRYLLKSGEAVATLAAAVAARAERS